MSIDSIQLSFPYSSYDTCQMQGVELELIKLEGAVQAIHDNLNYLKDRYLPPSLSLSLSFGFYLFISKLTHLYIGS